MKRGKEKRLLSFVHCCAVQEKQSGAAGGRSPFSVRNLTFSKEIFIFI